MPLRILSGKGAVQIMPFWKLGGKAIFSFGFARVTEVRRINPENISDKMLWRCGSTETGNNIVNFEDYKNFLGLLPQLSEVEASSENWFSKVYPCIYFKSFTRQPCQKWETRRQKNITTLTFGVYFWLYFLFLRQIVAQKICKGAIVIQEFLIRSELGDFTVNQYDNLIHFWQEADSMRHQHPGLWKWYREKYNLPILSCEI